MNSHKSAVRAFLKIDHALDFRDLSLQAGLYWPLSLNGQAYLVSAFSVPTAGPLWMNQNANLREC